MKKFNIEIKETLSTVVEVEAENKEDAISQVEEQYFNCDIVLSADNYLNTEINAI